MRHLLKRSILLSLIVLAALFSAGKFSSSGLTSARVTDDTLPRRPLGVYAKVNIEETKKQFEEKNTKKGIANSPDTLHAEFRKLYARLLANPAIAGIAVGAHWDNIEKAETFPNGYD